MGKRLRKGKIKELNIPPEMLEKLGVPKNFYCPCCDKVFPEKTETGDFVEHLAEHNKEDLIDAIVKISFALAQRKL